MRWDLLPICKLLRQLLQMEFSGNSHLLEKWCAEHTVQWRENREKQRGRGRGGEGERERGEESEREEGGNNLQCG